MEYIEKKRHEDAHALIEGFLKRHHDVYKAYQKDLYEYFRDENVEGVATRRALIEILVDEQNYRCCYCMRRVNTGHTIEHVIVNHPRDEEDYNRYLGNESQLDDADIMLSYSFVERQLPPPPYPHSVAYENMLMSCDGHCCIGNRTSFTCNNYRGNRFVYPLPLMKNITNEVRYRKDGFVYWTNETDTKHPTIESLGLNYNLLKLIRRLWCKIATMGLDAANCNRQSLIYEVLGDMVGEGASDESMQSLFLFIENDGYWDLFIQFDYFNDVTKFE